MRLLNLIFLIILDDTCKEYYEDDWIWGEEASGEEAVEETEDDNDDGSGSGSGDKGDFKLFSIMNFSRADKKDLS